MKTSKAFFQSELKHGIKSTRFISLLIIGFVVGLLLFFSLSSKEINRATSDQQTLSERPNFLYNFYFESFNQEMSSRLDEQTKEIIVLGKEISLRAEEAFQRSDLAEFYYQLTRLNLIIAKHSLQGVQLNPGSTTSEQRESWEAEIRQLWDDIEPGFSFEEISFNITLYPFVEEPDRWLSETEYYYKLSLLDVPILSQESVNGWSFFYQFGLKVLPYWMLICAVLISIDSIRRDLDTGVIKTILTSGISRSVYIATKTLINWILSSITALIPAFIISIALGMQRDAGYLNYPVLFFKNGWSSLRAIPSYFDIVKPKIGFNFYSGISLSPVNQHLTPIFNSTTWITLKEMIAGIFVLSLLSIFLYVLVVQIFSIILQNRIVALGLSGSAILVATLTSAVLAHGNRNNLSPFSMNHPVRILGGLHNVTPLVSLLILLFSIASIYIFNLLIWQRKHL